MCLHLVSGVRGEGARRVFSVRATEYLSCIGAVLCGYFCDPDLILIAVSEMVQSDILK